MLRPYLYTIISFLLVVTLRGQSASSVLYPMQQVQDTLVIKVIEGASGLSIEPQNRISMALLSLDPPRLEDADLVLDWTPKIKEEELSYSLEVRLVYPATGQILGRQKVQSTVALGAAPFAMRFPDLTEQGLYLGESYHLIISRQLLGSLDCAAERPVFSAERQLLPVGIAAAGLTSVVIGELVFGKQQRDRYEEYEIRWQAGETNDAGLLAQSENARDTRRIMTYGGGLVMAGGTIWWYLRARKVKKEQRLYDTYCLPLSDEMGLAPILFTDSPQGGLGLRLSFKLD